MLLAFADGMLQRIEPDLTTGGKDNILISYTLPLQESSEIEWTIFIHYAYTVSMKRIFSQKNVFQRCVQQVVLEALYSLRQSKPDITFSQCAFIVENFSHVCISNSYVSYHNYLFESVAYYQLSLPAYKLLRTGRVWEIYESNWCPWKV